MPDSVNDIKLEIQTSDIIVHADNDEETKVEHNQLETENDDITADSTKKPPCRAVGKGMLNMPCF